jgi:hypothetical protein
MHAAVQDTTALASARTAHGITRQAAIRGVGGLATASANETHGRSGQTLTRTSHDAPGSPAP